MSRRTVEGRSGILRTLAGAWGRVLRLWRPMAGWTLLIWAAVTVVLVPLSSLLLGWGAFRGGDAIVGNEDLVGWMLSPAGLSWILLSGSLALIAGVVRYAGLFVMLTDDLEGRPAGVLTTVRALAPDVDALLRMCGLAVAAAGLLGLLLAAGLLAIWHVFLGAHDINYYLAVRPPGWSHALMAAGAWTTVWLIVASWLLGRSLLVLPAWIDGHRPLRRALRRSWKRSRGGHLPLLRLVLVPLALWLGVRTLVDGSVGSAVATGLQGLQAATGSVTILAAATAAAMGLSLAVDAIVEFLGFSTVSAVLTRVYHRDTHLHAGAPSVTEAVRETRGAVREALAPWTRPWRAALATAGLVTASLLAGGLLLEGMAQPDRVTVVAHRGGPPPAPENTLAALEAAVEAGADYSEMDVQLTRDGVPVAVHDADLMRVAGDPRRVSAILWRELEDLPLRSSGAGGAAMPPEERRVPTLDRLLERADDRIGLEIELKFYGRDTALASAVVRAVRARGMEERVAVTSLNLDAIRQVGRLAPEIRRGYAAAVTVGDLSRLAVDFLTVARHRVTPALLRAAHERGIAVQVWTVNQVPEMAEMIRLGADGLVTDRPADAIRVREEFGDLPAAARLLLRFQPFRLADADGV